MVLQGMSSNDIGCCSDTLFLKITMDDETRDGSSDVFKGPSDFCVKPLSKVRRRRNAFGIEYSGLYEIIAFSLREAHVRRIVFAQK